MGRRTCWRAAAAAIPAASSRLSVPCCIRASSRCDVRTSASGTISARTSKTWTAADAASATWRRPRSWHADDESCAGPFAAHITRAYPGTHHAKPDGHVAVPGRTHPVHLPHAASCACPAHGPPPSAAAGTRATHACDVSWCAATTSDDAVPVRRLRSWSSAATLRAAALVVR